MEHDIGKNKIETVKVEASRGDHLVYVSVFLHHHLDAEAQLELGNAVERAVVDVVRKFAGL